MASESARKSAESRNKHRNFTQQDCTPSSWENNVRPRSSTRHSTSAQQADRQAKHKCKYDQAACTTHHKVAFTLVGSVRTCSLYHRTTSAVRFAPADFCDVYSVHWERRRLRRSAGKRLWCQAFCASYLLEAKIARIHESASLHIPTSAVGLTSSRQSFQSVIMSPLRKHLVQDCLHAADTTVLYEHRPSSASEQHSAQSPPTPHCPSQPTHRSHSRPSPPEAIGSAAYSTPQA